MLGSVLINDKVLLVVYVIEVMEMYVHVQGVGRRYANLVCKKADIDMNKRAGELTDEEVRRFCFN